VKFSIQHSPNWVPLGRPEANQAFVEFARDRIFRVGEVIDPGAILQYDRVTGSAEKILERAA